MYQEHFGLSRPPFKITPDTSLFYAGNQRGAMLEALVYAIKSGEGIIKVVGEVGSGKTMLCRMLEMRLSGEVDVIYIANPSLSPDNILHVIAHELQLEANNETSKVDVMHRIQAHLLKKHAANRQVVLFVEEAQSMPIETLEEIRLLSNLETDENKLLQMVLFGQPELDEKLSEPNIRQLKERITHSFNLSPFPPDDTLQYLNFRLRAVGYKGPDIFNKTTAGAIKKYSKGLTRRINIIADKSLMAAFSEGSHSVVRSHVKIAAQDNDYIKAAPDKKLIVATAGALLFIIALLAGFYLGKQTPEELFAGQLATDRTSTDAGIMQKQPAVPSATLSHVSSSDASQGASLSGRQTVETEMPPLLAKQLQQTGTWLNNVADSHYSIQLFMVRTSDADSVAAFLGDAPETLDFTKIHIYETVINGRNWYSVVYDDFATQSKAIESLDSLPSSLKASGPYLRRISALKKDYARDE
ncbi:MAG: AAA family ATPase [Gammaproteobacteria bacterium]|nr:AAA family ATPase [Gammaproteobacteria bacterium]